MVGGEVDAVRGCGVEEEEDEEENGSRDVDEGVYAVGPVKEERVLQEPVLDWEFPEYVEGLLEVDYLEGVAASDVDGTLEHCHGAEGAAKLIDLRVLVGYMCVYVVACIPSRLGPNTRPQPRKGTSSTGD